MSAAELVARLAQEGIDPVLLSEIAQELFLGEAERRSLADRRQNERDRKAAQRVRHGKSRDSAGQAVKSPDPSPNERDNLTPTREPPKPSGLDPKPKMHRLPADWEPQPFKAGSMAAITIIRWEPGRMERELAKFRDHHTAAGSRFVDWQAAWSKWVNGSDDFQRGTNGRQPPPNIGKTTAAIAMLGDFHDDRPM